MASNSQQTIVWDNFWKFSPTWKSIELTQVVGRAIRITDHSSLPNLDSLKPPFSPEKKVLWVDSPSSLKKKDHRDSSKTRKQKLKYSRLYQPARNM